jgi:hypothetical protein
MKVIRREDVILEHNGKEYIGTRVIEGTKRIFQVIHYGGLSRFDGAAYKPKDESIMRSVAKVILLELISELEKKK